MANVEVFVTVGIRLSPSHSHKNWTWRNLFSRPAAAPLLPCIVPTLCTATYIRLANFVRAVGDNRGRGHYILIDFEHCAYANMVPKFWLSTWGADVLDDAPGGAQVYSQRSDCFAIGRLMAAAEAAVCCCRRPGRSCGTSCWPSRCRPLKPWPIPAFNSDKNDPGAHAGPARLALARALPFLRVGGKGG